MYIFCIHYEKYDCKQKKAGKCKNPFLLQNRREIMNELFREIIFQCDFYFGSFAGFFVPNSREKCPKNEFNIIFYFSKWMVAKSSLWRLREGCTRSDFHPIAKIIDPDYYSNFYLASKEFFFVGLTFVSESINWYNYGVAIQRCQDASQRWGIVLQQEPQMVLVRCHSSKARQHPILCGMRWGTL